jgi:hypothetical protein
MRKTLLSATLGLAVAFGANAQERYLDEIFTSVTVAPAQVYGQNYYFTISNIGDLVNIPPAANPTIGDQKMDIYSPEGDVATDRMAVIVLHTGNFLPRYLNQSATGAKEDNSVVQLCNKLAKRGFVVFAVSYRLGWDPLNSDLNVRRGTLLNAVYRGLHDVKTSVRYLKKSVAENSNPYGIDPNKITVFGFGTGGYLAANYDALDRYSELQIQKFTIPGTTPPQVYVDTALVGQIDGSGGTLNVHNYPSYSNDIMVAVNAGGAIGDSTWIEGGEIPNISFHCPDDPFAPFEHGMVFVPTTPPQAVVPVSGSKWIIEKANEFGNNDVFTHPYSDPYSQAAYTACASGHPALGLNAANYEGLFPFRRPTLGANQEEASPWDWWDEAVLTATVTQINSLFGQSLDAAAIHASGLNNNPDMSQAKSAAYIDSIVGYMCPRLVSAGMVGINDLDAVSRNLSVFPNPAEDVLNIKALDGMRISGIEVIGMDGKSVVSRQALNTHLVSMQVADLTPGLYLIRILTDRGMTTQRVSVQ